MFMRRWYVFLVGGVFAATLVGCGDLFSTPAPPTPPPATYLSTALDWIEAHAVKADPVAWAAIRQQALALVPAPQTARATYPALTFALQQLGDGNAFLLDPQEVVDHPGPGVIALYPDGLIVFVQPGSPAEQAGLRTGDVLTTVNGQALRPFNSIPQNYNGSWQVAFDPGPSSTYTVTLHKAGAGPPVEASFAGITIQYRYEGKPLVRRLAGSDPGIGVIDLPYDAGSTHYATLAQQGMRAADTPPVCGWIVDVRRNVGGDIWTLLAAIGPLLGEGQVGGFVYRDGTKDTWAYRDGKVFWNTEARDESAVDGGIYQLQRPLPPVALLTSRATQAAGELLVVAFKGRAATRTFGEATGGSPALLTNTALSDGAGLFVSGANALDRTGAVYSGRIAPDQPVALDWPQIGTDADPVLQAARAWLLTQPDCRP